jgi:hypothetical protein
MGSSYRSSLNNGSMRDWEKSLREAISLIITVTDELSDTIGDDGQYDNAADDGALSANLWTAIDLIRSELPLTDKERIEKIEELERRIERLKKQKSSSAG